LFSRAYTTCPSCIPARHSLLTGLFPATSGVVGFKGRPYLAHVAELNRRRRLHNGARPVGPCTRSRRRALWLPKEFRLDVRGRGRLRQLPQKDAPETGGIRPLVEKLGRRTTAGKPNLAAGRNFLHPNAWVAGQARKALQDVPSDKPLFSDGGRLFRRIRRCFRRSVASTITRNKSVPSPAHGDWGDWAALTTNGRQSGPSRAARRRTVARRGRPATSGIEQLDLAGGRSSSPISKSGAAKPAGLADCVHDRSWRNAWRPRFFTAMRAVRRFGPIFHFIVAGSPDWVFRRGLVSDQPDCLEDIMPTPCSRWPARNAPSRWTAINLAPALRREKQIVRALLHLDTRGVLTARNRLFHALTTSLQIHLAAARWNRTVFDLDKDPRESATWQRTIATRGIGKVADNDGSTDWPAARKSFRSAASWSPGRPYPPLQGGRASANRIGPFAEQDKSRNFRFGFCWVRVRAFFTASR